MKNLTEFKELIKKYQSITLEQIQEIWKGFQDNTDDDIGDMVANILTGFGQGATCSLCYAVGFTCQLCVYEKETGCIWKDEESQETYHAISTAETPESLLEAFNARAEYMEELIEDVE